MTSTHDTGPDDDAFLDPTTRSERTARDGRQGGDAVPGPGSTPGQAPDVDEGPTAWTPAPLVAAATTPVVHGTGPATEPEGHDPAQGGDPDEATGGSGRPPGRWESGRGRVAAITGSVVAIVATVALVAWWFGYRGADPGEPVAAAATSASPSAARTPTPTPTPTATPTAEPTPQLATPEPVAAPVPPPTIASVPAGTVVAEGDVTSPKGSIRFRYRVVADGDDTFSVEWSDFTSTLPVPVGAAFLDVTPAVGDGLTWYGVGQQDLGGPTTAPTSATTSLGDTRQPTPYVTLVTYSATTDTAVPVEIGPGKVLAVTPVTWSVPARQTNVAPVDSGSATYATGTVTGATASGAPAGYRVAPDDLLGAVAARFGLSVEALIWLNEGLEVLGDEQALFVDTTLNLDPAAR